MNSRIRMKRQYVTLSRRSRNRFVRKEGFTIARPLSRQFESSFDEETPIETLSSLDNGMLPPTTSSGGSSPAYNMAIQDPRMTFSLFVESKFIPEHVQRKTLTGQRHYQAILKHLLRPETVNSIFNPQNVTNPRLKFVPDWPYLDEVRLCDITSDHVRRLIGSASDHGYSSQTIKHIRNVLFATISHAQQEGCFTGANPVSQVKMPPPSPTVKHNLTISQTRGILNLMKYPDREIALFCLTTDMTIVEICELQWNHVNLSGSEVYSEGEFLPPLCIAVRTNWNHFGLEDYKHGRNRNIDIPEPLLSHLLELRMHAGTSRGTDLILTTQKGRPILPETIGIERLKPIRRRLGIPWLSWQVLRRARLSLLAEFRTQLADQIMDRFPGLHCNPTADSAQPNVKTEESADSKRNIWSKRRSA